MQTLSNSEPFSASSIRSVVLVHGALVDGSCWAKVIAALQPFHASFRTIAVQLPNSSMLDDIATVQRTLDQVDGPVLLVGHSYGGAVITEAGNHAKVTALMYVSAGAPDSGESFNTWWKDYPAMPARSQFRPYGTTHYVITEHGMRHDIAQDASQDEVDLMIAVQKPLGIQCFDGPVGSAAWKTKRSCWYIVTTNDRVLPLAAQRDTAQRIGATVIELQTGHMPMLTAAAEVATFIRKAAQQTA